MVQHVRRRAGLNTHQSFAPAHQLTDSCHPDGTHDFRLRRGVNEVFTLLGCYAAQLVVFTDVSGPLKMGQIGCSEELTLKMEQIGCSEELTLKMGQIGCPETSVTITVRCVTLQKTEYLIFTAAEACNNAIEIGIGIVNN
jgi:hypothetical protein